MDNVEPKQGQSEVDILEERRKLNDQRYTNLLDRLDELQYNHMTEMQAEIDGIREMLK